MADAIGAFTGFRPAAFSFFRGLANPEGVDGAELLASWSVLRVRQFHSGAPAGAAAAPGNPHRRQPGRHLCRDRRARLPTVPWSAAGKVPVVQSGIAPQPET